MIRAYADGSLIYDSRMEEDGLLGIKTVRGVNKGGKAEIILPPDHSAYDRFIPYRTVVEIYRDTTLKFRGRFLYSEDDFDRLRTLVCEGELCFLQDAVSRPRLYRGSPRDILTDIITDYNTQVEPFKRFYVGSVTVKDPYGSLYLETNYAESVLETVLSFIKRYGGYITFSTHEASGRRLIHWLADMGKDCSQVIEIGENLFDFTRSGADTELCTALIPYGAKLADTGKRLTVSDVNGGVDIIKDSAAIRTYGTITKTVVWDDVTLPGVLLDKARRYLRDHNSVVTSLELTAFDLSYVDLSLDSFEVGDRVRVRSAPHGLDEYFRINDVEENLFDPEDGLLNLGKEVYSLTGLGAEADRNARNLLNQEVADLQRRLEALEAAARSAV